MNMVILFISGMCMGAGILMSTQYGAKKYEQLEKQLSEEAEDETDSN